MKKILLAMVALVCTILAAWQMLALRADWQYNYHSANGNFAKAAQHQSDYGVYAAAVDLQNNRQWVEAQQRFASLDLAAGSALHTAVLFKLSENYVTQAVAFEKTDNAAQGVALLELAKENYRRILFLQPGNWLARENLAQVLRILPDVRLYSQEQEDVLPERSPQAPVQAIGHDRLP